MIHHISLSPCLLQYSAHLSSRLALHLITTARWLKCERLTNMYTAKCVCERCFAFTFKHPSVSSFDLDMIVFLFLVALGSCPSGG